MSARGDKAKELFQSGYNCSQSVLIAFSDITGLSEETSAMIASGFGGGMGRMREVCGAVSGMFMVAGFLYGTTDKDGEAEKAAHALGADTAFADVLLHGPRHVGLARAEGV